MTQPERESVIALDTSVVVPALLSWHEHHDPCRRGLVRILSSQQRCVLPLPVLIESYAVMTRLPPPHRLSPETALVLLTTTFFERCRLTAMASEDGWQFVRSLADREISGGRTYDAAIMACAQRGDARRILTLNSRHFERLVPEIEVQQPA